MVSYASSNALRTLLTYHDLAMQAHDRESALAIHMELLRTGSMTDDIGLWMAGVKQVIMRL